MQESPKGFARVSGVDATFSGGGAGAHARLWAIVIGTGAASAVVTVYNGDAATDPVVATLTATAAITHNFWGCRVPDGLFVKITGGAADITVIYS